MADDQDFPTDIENVRHYSLRLLGAIAGDMVGSPYEHYVHKDTDFPLFTPASRYTDDTVLTVAVAHAILEGGDYAASLRSFGRL